MAKDPTSKSGEQIETEGKTEELGGRVQRAWGDLTGDAHHQAEGARKEVKGKVKGELGEAKGELGEAKRKLDDIDRI